MNDIYAQGYDNPSGPPARKRMRRNTSDRWIAGVCSGIADYFGIDATLVRILFVASILLPGPQVLLYLVLWLVIPKR